MALLNRGREALREGLRLLDDSRTGPNCCWSWPRSSTTSTAEAAVLKEEALQLATTPLVEASVRHHIGRRLFNEARYRDAAAEFQWACDLYRVSGHHEQAERSRQAMERSRRLLRQA